MDIIGLNAMIEGIRNYSYERRRKLLKLHSLERLTDVIEGLKC